MKTFSAPFASVILSLTLCPPPAPARQSSQAAADDKCGGPVYAGGEVTRRARITRKPEPGFTEEALANNAYGVVRLTAVLCRTGRVTDIKVEQGLSHGMTEQVVEAARRMKFEQAVKDGRKVSQTIKLEYAFSSVGGGGEGEGPEGWAKHAGRLVEEIVIEGNRRLTDEQILGHIRTRQGDAFSEATVRGDLQTLLDLGTLDPAQTRVTTEAGVRGGVVVVFSVSELPIIRDIELVGLKGVTEAEAAAALRRGGVSREAPYSAAKVRAARSEILALLASRGHAGASVEVSVDAVSSVSVVLRFVLGEGGGR